MVEDLVEFEFDDRQFLNVEILKPRNLEKGILDYGRLVDNVTFRIVYEGFLAAIKH